MKTKTDYVFEYMRSKYCTWWYGVNGRVGTLERYDAERAAWDDALRPYSLRQVRETLRILRPNYQHSVPRVDQFVDLLNRRFELSRPVASEHTRRHLAAIREILH